MFPHLHGLWANVSLVQEAASKELIEILDKCDGTKAIIWDESLSGPIGLVSKYTLLRERNVMKMLQLKPGALPDIDVRNIIFITRPNLNLMNNIAENVHSIEKRQKSGFRKELFLYFLPRLSTLCENQLKNKGVYGSFTHVGELSCDFFPVDNDLLSMELKDSFRELYIENDPTCIFLAARALVSLQKLYGRIPKIYGKGNSAKKLWDLLKDMSKDELNQSTTGKCAIDQLIILDRSIDLMSVLATQLTYEGLIDENYGINQTTAHFPAEKFSTSDESSMQSTSEKKTIVLNSGEELYMELRDKNFNAIGQILSRRLNEISRQLDERHNDKSVQEIKKFVERLPNIMAYKKSLATHTTIAEMLKEITSSDEFLDELECEQEFLLCSDVEKINPFIEDLIANQAPLKTVIRLICMQSIAGTGLKPKVLDFYKRELAQVYGVEVLLAFSNLEKAGLIKIQSGSRSYTVLRKTFRLTVDDTNEITPNDISYVHTIYAPLTVRIVERTLKPNGWQSLSDILSTIPGPTFEEYQSTDPTSPISGRRGSFSSEISQSDSPKVVLVFFLGGCTFAEISALRFLSRQEDNNVEFVIATTKLINKNSFLENLME